MYVVTQIPSEIGSTAAQQHIDIDVDRYVLRRDGTHAGRDYKPLGHPKDAHMCNYIATPAARTPASVPKELPRHHTRSKRRLSTRSLPLAQPLELKTR